MNDPQLILAEVWINDVAVVVGVHLSADSETVQAVIEEATTP